MPSVQPNEMDASIALNPILIGVLSSGLAVNPCPFVDVWGSSITYTGPYPSFRAPHLKECGVSLMIEGAEQLSRPEKTVFRPPRDGVVITKEDVDTDTISAPASATTPATGDTQAKPGFTELVL